MNQGVDKLELLTPMRSAAHLFHERCCYHHQQNYDRIMRPSRPESAAAKESRHTKRARAIAATTTVWSLSLSKWPRLVLLAMAVLGSVHAHEFRGAPLATQNSTNGTASSPYMMIIDGGSTGSRLHIFEFTASSVERRGSFRTDLPLSAYATTADTEPTLCTDHVQPLLDAAAQTIPVAWHRSTPFYYAATAGMRLVSLGQQERVYNAVHQCVSTTSPWEVQPYYIATLSGELEGYYGAVAANYLLGTLHVNLTLASSSATRATVVGALDMGGSSTQMVMYTPVSQSSRNDSSQALHPDSFFSTSYLSYGVDQMRDRLWQLLIQESNAARVFNPCSNPGHTTMSGDVELTGTGNVELCARYLLRLIPNPSAVQLSEQSVPTEPNQNYTVGGIQHPPVQGRSFLAMSLYFFALDAVRVWTRDTALEAAWPTPTLDELTRAVTTMCGWDWSTMLALSGTHRYTRDTVLPHRCFEAVYMITLLRHGFGFDPQARDITFAFDVNESEVEWTLGMALQLRSAKQTAAKAHSVLSPETKAPQCTSPKESESRPRSEEDPQSVCSSDKQENATFEKDHERRSGWVQMVAEVLVSDGELFSSLHQR